MDERREGNFGLQRNRPVSLGTVLLGCAGSLALAACVAYASSVYGEGIEKTNERIIEYLKEDHPSYFDPRAPTVRSR